MAKDGTQTAHSVMQQFLARQAQGDNNPAAVALGRLGGLKGGKARAKKLTKAQRSDIARKGGLNRWKNKKD